jgi:hypothetical protein
MLGRRFMAASKQKMPSSLCHRLYSAIAGRVKEQLSLEPVLRSALTRSAGRAFLLLRTTGEDASGQGSDQGLRLTERWTIHLL